jgi:hypothetical protein
VRIQVDLHSDLIYLNRFIQFEVWFFIFSLLTIVFYLIIATKINTKRLLFDNKRTRSYSWGKVQVLIFTLLGVLYYIIEIIHNFPSGDLPELPLAFLLILGASNAVYLGIKLYALLFEER